MIGEGFLGVFKSLYSDVECVQQTNVFTLRHLHRFFSQTFNILRLRMLIKMGGKTSRLEFFLLKIAWVLKKQVVIIYCLARIYFHL